MILLTGAAGKTGRAVLKALVSRGLDVRVLVRRREQMDELKKHGAVDALVGDMVDDEIYQRAMPGIKAIYHICPNLHPSEIEIGRLAIKGACEFNLEQFVYHSVLHPQTEKMPHHWQKLRVEEMLFESDLDFNILQPAPYMQNILAGKDSILNQGLYRVPYLKETRLSMLDLVDLGEAAAEVLTDPGHRGAVYEVVGTGGLSQSEVAADIGKVLGRRIKVEEVPIKEWRREAQESGIGPYQLETLAKMFDYYAHFGLYGSNNVTRWLLRREPASLTDFINREFN